MNGLSIVVFLLALFAANLVSSQNLVPNGSFETYSSLPNSSGDWSFCVGWNNVNLNPGAWPYATPDYFHTSGTGGGNLPNSAFATVSPQNGNAIIGLYSKHSSALNSRDYMSAQLTTPLTVGSAYTISFWMTSGSGNYYYGSSMSNMGIRLSTAPLTQVTHENIGGTPQAMVTTAPWLPNWTFYSFTYVATSAFSYVTIGNFHPDAAVTTTMHASSANFPTAAYYFFDNVRIEQTSLLPVELISFDASKESDRVRLDWKTNVEINNDFFTVERSTDLIDWTSVGRVEGAGNSTEIQNYQLYDLRPLSGVTYYRLSQTDVDGTMSYSDIRTVDFVGPNELRIYPIPANEQITVQSNGKLDDFRVLNPIGQDVTDQVILLDQSNDDLLLLDISHLASGYYFFRANGGVEKFQKL